MCIFGVDYCALIVILEIPYDQGVFDSPNFENNPNIIVFRDAECITLFESSAFSVFLLVRKLNSINCRSPPFISL